MRSKYQASAERIPAFHAGSIKKAFLALALALALLSPACQKPRYVGHKQVIVNPTSPIDKQHMSSHQIYFNQFLQDGVYECTATAVGPHQLLTAGHCYMNRSEIYLDRSSHTTQILGILVDGNDHSIYVVDTTFDTYSKIDQRPLTAYEKVHFWGNPGKNYDVYREGYFVNQFYDKDAELVLQQFVLPVYGGDSGSGMFDANGNIVAVVSLGNTSAQEYSLPLSFTDAQLATLK